MKVQLTKDFKETQTYIPGENSLYQIDNVYKAKVLKNIKINTEKYKQGDTIEITIAVGIRQEKDGNVGDLIPLNENEIKYEDGTYILFLQEQDLGTNTVFRPINNYHTYKLEEDGKTYKNVASQEIPTITEDELTTK
ncbi:MAG: hypothetical protein K0R71_1220 [Bacillales bacterium]|nr:hypothetical protein [Bacillales bacterium]